MAKKPLSKAKKISPMMIDNTQALAQKRAIRILVDLGTFLTFGRNGLTQHLTTG